MYVAVTAFLFEAFICRVQVELGGREEGITFSVDSNGRDDLCLKIGQKARVVFRRVMSLSLFWLHRECKTR